MEEKNNYLTLIDDEGHEINCDVLFTFDNDQNKQSYIVYTDNTLDETGSTKVYASIYDPTGKDKHLKPIESDEEWALIENILSSIQEKVDDEEANESAQI